MSNQESAAMVRCPTCGQEAAVDQIHKLGDPMEEFTLPFKVIGMAIRYGLLRLTGRSRRLRR